MWTDNSAGCGLSFSLTGEGTEHDKHCSNYGVNTAVVPLSLFSSAPPLNCLMSEERLSLKLARWRLTKTPNHLHLPVLVPILLMWLMPVIGALAARRLAHLQRLAWAAAGFVLSVALVALLPSGPDVTLLVD